MMLPSPISKYFSAEDSNDVESVVELFADDATVVDEDRTWSGLEEIRAWRTGPAALYSYTTEVREVVDEGDGRFLVAGRIRGDFPGGVADLNWRFVIAEDRIRQLQIAP